MGLFNRKKDAPEPPVEDDADPEALLAHLVQVAVQGALEATDESADRVAEHLAVDMGACSHEVLAAALGLAVISEGQAIANQIRRAASLALGDLLGNVAQEAAEGGQERPTDLLPDDEPTQAPEAVSEPHTAAEPEKEWPEDRR